jgi:hypothetical protein
MNKILLGFLLILALGSCYHSAPDAPFKMELVIPADSMVTLLTDIHMAEGIISNVKDKKIPVGHLSAEYFDTVLKQHQIDRETFEESMRYYAFHTEKLNDIYEQVIINLSKMESMINAENEADSLSKEALP